MQSLLTRWADALLAWLGLTSALNNGWDRWVAFALVVLSVVLLDFLCRTVLVRGIRRIVMRTKATWDDELFSSAVLSRLCNIVSAIVLVIVLPVVFDEQSEARTIVTRLIQVYIVVTVFRFINALLYAAFNIVSARPAWQNKPINGLRQTGQGIAALICGILIVSILIGKSPAILLTGLGASAAVIMLVFRDSILGFVSGIQLSANDMLKVGDWITVPKYGAGRFGDRGVAHDRQSAELGQYDRYAAALPAGERFVPKLARNAGVGRPPREAFGEPGHDEREILYAGHAGPVPQHRHHPRIYRPD